MSRVASLDIASPEFKANPYPFWARLRAEAPVYRAPLSPKKGVWVVTRYDDAVAVLQDERFVKNPAEAMTPEQLAERPWRSKLFRPLDHSMLDLDPPAHTRLRALVHKAFAPRLVERLRERIQALCGELLDAAQPRGTMDVVAEYAHLLPAAITAELLGVPAEHLARWANIYRADFGGAVLTLLREKYQFMCYLRDLFERRRAEPRDDLISALVRAREAGSALTDDELISMVTLLFEAGTVTTVNLIGSGTLALLEYPDQLGLLRRDPSLIKSAVEELLRYTNPLDLATSRFTRADVTIAGVTIPRGEDVLVVLGSANRDEQRFEDPETLNITREPNEHLAFGWGRHYCLGAPLARMEGQIAINTLLARLPNLRLAQPAASLRWRRDALLRGLESLPVAF